MSKVGRFLVAILLGGSVSCVLNSPRLEVLDQELQPKKAGEPTKPGTSSAIPNEKGGFSSDLPFVNESEALTAKNQLARANELLKLTKFEAALEQYQSFQRTYPRSIYILSSRLGEAESLEGLARWSEALVIYKSIYDVAVNAQPEIAALAQYRLSFCFEALGDDVRAVAALLDSLKRKKDLPLEIAQAEIPARLSMLYGKVQNFDESQKYALLAQQGLSEMQGRPDISPVTLAKAYYQMGSVSMNQISLENLTDVLRAQKTVQNYLLKAIDLNVVPWSGEAAEKLKRNYRDVWNVLFAMPVIGAIDPEAQIRNQRTLQLPLAADFVDLIQNAENYRPLDEAKMNSLEKGLYAYLAEVRQRAEENIFRAEEWMSLTSESQKLNGIRRPGRIREDKKLSTDPTGVTTPRAARANNTPAEIRNKKLKNNSSHTKNSEKGLPIEPAIPDIGVDPNL